MKADGRAAFFANSALAFASAQLLTAALHEAGHGLAAQALGFAPRIYAFYEDNPTGAPWQTLVILAAGPLASLVLGIGFWFWLRSMRPAYAFGRLLLVWMALLGVMEFVNYLVVTPWLRAGDTAQMADILGWSTAARYGVFAVGVALVAVLARPAAHAMISVAPRAFALDTRRAVRRYIFGGFYVPLLAGVALTALAGIGSRPVYVGYGALAALGSVDIVAAARYAGETRSDGEGAGDPPQRIEPSAIALYAAVALAYVFALSRGVPI